jgi:hypothetical protein
MLLRTLCAYKQHSAVMLLVRVTLQNPWIKTDMPACCSIL